MNIRVSDYLNGVATAFPEKVAIIDANGKVTFSQLIESGRRIASKLVDIHISRKPVAVYMSKSKEEIITFLGINYSGNFYVPLDIKSPGMRIKSILDTLESDIVITDQLHYDNLKLLYSGNVLIYEDIINNACIEDALINSAINSIIDTDPVYSIFTSGSTGTPKGVVVSHRGVIDYIDWAVNVFNISDNAIIGNQSPFYFDNSTLDIYLMYATGATLVIVPEEIYIFPSRLIDFLNEYRINFIFWVPYILINIANLRLFDAKKPAYLQNILFAGEVMPNIHLNYWRKHLPNCVYANLYGPTEITVDCTYYIVKREFRDDEPLPIGYPCRNSDILIMNEKDEITKVDEYGELCVRGSSLALGYYNDWDKTSKSFVQNPLNKHYPELIYRTGDLVYKNQFGEIIFVGRKDSQIKHLGYRIELGEIETAIQATKMVDFCCVTYDQKGKEIVLFYESKTELSVVDFRTSLLSMIPKYMLPTSVNKVEKLRLNSNGKIDRLFYNKQVNQL